MCTNSYKVFKVENKEEKYIDRLKDTYIHTQYTIIHVHTYIHTHTHCPPKVGYTCIIDVNLSLFPGTASYTLLKSNVTTWSVGGRCRGSQECGSRNVNFACKFHWRWHAVFGSSHNSEIYIIGARAQ